MEARQGRRLAWSAAIFSIATGISRVLGLIRDVIASYYFGARGPINAFTVAFQIPNLIRVLVGDAAHNVHPLAGQGVNLGFRDARELARVLAQRAPQNNCGDYRLLRRFERARREDIAALEWVTDSLQKLFNNDKPWLAKLRNAGLRMSNRQHTLKNLLVQHAVG